MPLRTCEKKQGFYPVGHQEGEQKSDKVCLDCKKSFRISQRIGQETLLLNLCGLKSGQEKKEQTKSAD